MRDNQEIDIDSLGGGPATGAVIVIPIILWPVPWLICGFCCSGPGCTSCSPTTVLTAPILGGVYGGLAGLAILLVGCCVAYQRHLDGEGRRDDEEYRRDLDEERTRNVVANRFNIRNEDTDVQETNSGHEATFLDPVLTTTQTTQPVSASEQPQTYPSVGSLARVATVSEPVSYPHSISVFDESWGELNNRANTWSTAVHPQAPHATLFSDVNSRHIPNPLDFRAVAGVMMPR